MCGRFIEFSASAPVAAVEYLKTHVNAVVDHSDHDESRQVDNIVLAIARKFSITCLVSRVDWYSIPF